MSSVSLKVTVNLIIPWQPPDKQNWFWKTVYTIVTSSVRHKYTNSHNYKWYQAAQCTRCDLHNTAMQPASHLTEHKE